jgi:hypothetical protein
MLGALGALWAHGAEPDWSGFDGNQRRHRVPAPLYPFERKPHFVPPPQARVDGAGGDAPAVETRDGRIADLADWVHQPTWTPLPPALPSPDAPAGPTLVLVDPAARPDHADPAAWQSSPTPGGSPGHSEALDFATWAAPFGHPVPTSDNDGDQRNALLEFAEGTDPQGHESPGKTTEIFREPGGSVIVSFRRNLRASGITIELESSPNLEDWQPAGPDWTYLGEQNLGDGHARVYYRSHSPGTARYLRQRITLR